MVSKPGRWARRSLLGAAATYVWGFLSSLSIPDVEETCGTHDRYWEFDPDHRSSMLPLSNPCNPSYDLVAPYVNPVFFAFLTSSVVFTAIAVVRRVRGKTP